MHRLGIRQQLKHKHAHLCELCFLPVPLRCECCSSRLIVSFLGSLILRAQCVCLQIGADRMLPSKRQLSMVLERSSQPTSSSGQPHLGDESRLSLDALTVLGNGLRASFVSARRDGGVERLELFSARNASGGSVGSIGAERTTSSASRHHSLMQLSQVCAHHNVVNCPTAAACLTAHTPPPNPPFPLAPLPAAPASPACGA
jgi:hypothetical protein